METVRPYPLGKATEAVDAQHELFKSLLGGLTAISLPPNIRRVLDVGCGTGVWTEEFALQHPEADILGIDLNPPSLSGSQSKNVHYLKADVEDDWTFVEQPYDFIHSRLLFTSITDWPLLLQRMYWHLTPSGYAQIQEAMASLKAEDTSLSHSASAYNRWWDVISARLKSRGVDLDNLDHLHEIARSVGFEVVEHRELRLYLDVERGQRHDRKQTSDVVEKFQSALNDILTVLTQNLFDANSNPTVEEVAVMAEAAREDIRVNPAARGYYHSTTVLVVRKQV